MTRRHDVVVVGGRCAGASLAMLLARRGLDVIVLERSRTIGETISTHLIQPPGSAALERWGLGPQVARAGAARIDRALTVSDAGTLLGPWHAVHGVDWCTNLRRSKLDRVLLEAAAAAGADVETGFTVDDITFERGMATGVVGHTSGSRAPIEVRGAMVVGADGRRSRIAQRVGAEFVSYVAPMTANYYSYMSGFDLDRGIVEVYARPPYRYVLLPTDDGLTVVNVIIPRSRKDGFRTDLERNYLAAFDREDGLGPRVRNARREGPIVGAFDLPTFYRRSYGPGWALVGDAVHHRDPILPLGIHEAFLGAESLAAAIHRGLSGGCGLSDALDEHERAFVQHTAFPQQLALEAAKLEAPTSEQQEQSRQMVAALQGKSRAIAAYRGLGAGSMTPERFFAPDTLADLLNDDEEDATCTALSS